MLLSPIFKGGGQKGDKISKFSETEIFFNYLIFGAKMLNIRKNAIKKGGISTALCGTDGNRTSDTRIFSPLLYQLSYGTSVLWRQKYDIFHKWQEKNFKK